MKRNYSMAAIFNDSDHSVCFNNIANIDPTHVSPIVAVARQRPSLSDLINLSSSDTDAEIYAKLVSKYPSGEFTVVANDDGTKPEYIGSMIDGLSIGDMVCSDGSFALHGLLIVLNSIVILISNVAPATIKPNAKYAGCKTLTIVATGFESRMRISFRSFTPECIMPVQFLQEKDISVRKFTVVNGVTFVVLNGSQIAGLPDCDLSVYSNEGQLKAIWNPRGVSTSLAALPINFKGSVMVYKMLDELITEHSQEFDGGLVLSKSVAANLKNFTENLRIGSTLRIKSWCLKISEPVSELDEADVSFLPVERLANGVLDGVQPTGEVVEQTAPIFIYQLDVLDPNRNDFGALDQMIRTGDYSNAQSCVRDIADFCALFTNLTAFRNEKLREMRAGMRKQLSQLFHAILDGLRNIGSVRLKRNDPLLLTPVFDIFNTVAGFYDKSGLFIEGIEGKPESTPITYKPAVTTISTLLSRVSEKDERTASTVTDFLNQLADEGVLSFDMADYRFEDVLKAPFVAPAGDELAPLQPDEIRRLQPWAGLLKTNPRTLIDVYVGKAGTDVEGVVQLSAEDVGDRVQDYDFFVAGTLVSSTTLSLATLGSNAYSALDLRDDFADIAKQALVSSMILQPIANTLCIARKAELIYEDMRKPNGFSLKVGDTQRPNIYTWYNWRGVAADVPYGRALPADSDAEGMVSLSDGALKGNPESAPTIQGFSVVSVSFSKPTYEEGVIKFNHKINFFNSQLPISGLDYDFQPSACHAVANHIIVTLEALLDGVEKAGAISIRQQYMDRIVYNPSVVKGGNASVQGTVTAKGFNVAEGVRNVVQQSSGVANGRDEYVANIAAAITMFLCPNPVSAEALSADRVARSASSDRRLAAQGNKRHKLFNVGCDKVKETEAYRPGYISTFVIRSQYSAAAARDSFLGAVNDCIPADNKLTVDELTATVNGWAKAQLMLANQLTTRRFIETIIKTRSIEDVELLVGVRSRNDTDFTLCSKQDGLNFTSLRFNSSFNEIQEVINSLEAALRPDLNSQELTASWLSFEVIKQYQKENDRYKDLSPDQFVRFVIDMLKRLFSSTGKQLPEAASIFLPATSVLKLVKSGVYEPSALPFYFNFSEVDV